MAGTEMGGLSFACDKRAYEDGDSILNTESNSQRLWVRWLVHCLGWLVGGCRGLPSTFSSIHPHILDRFLGYFSGGCVLRGIHSHSFAPRAGSLPRSMDSFSGSVVKVLESKVLGLGRKVATGPCSVSFASGWWWADGCWLVGCLVGWLVGHTCHLNGMNIHRFMVG